MTKHIAPEPTPTDEAASPTGLTRWLPWLAPLALVVALVAVVLAAWSLLNPRTEDNTATPVADPAPFTDQQTADAEARACAAFTSVRGAVATQTNANPDSDDPAVLDAAAANARLSTVAGAAYLRARLDPATPPQLAMTIRAFADKLEDVAINQLAGVPNDDPAQAARMGDTDAAMTQLGEICG